MTTKRIFETLRQHGLQAARRIAHSKTGHCKRYPKHFVVFNSQAFNRREQLRGHVDLDLSLDADRLTVAGSPQDASPQ
jgi:hypothetical protein